MGKLSDIAKGIKDSIEEDLGVGGGMASGQPAMSGHLGTYNSPNVTQNANSFRTNKKSTMSNNNTVVSSGYYDTVFDADIRKIMSILKELGFDVEWPENADDEEFHLSPDIRRQDHVHTQASSVGSRMSSNDVMNDTSGINITTDVVLKHLRTEFGDELYTKAKETDDKITYDDIMMGLKDVMRNLQYPDKDYATIMVLKNLIKQPDYYRALGKYDINEEEEIMEQGKINFDAINEIVREKMDAKLSHGREAFKHMLSELENPMATHGDEEKPLDDNIGVGDKFAYEGMTHEVLERESDFITHAHVGHGLANAKKEPIEKVAADNDKYVKGMMWYSKSRRSR